MSDGSERMWAPWRMEYIEAKKPAGCPFCEISVAPVEARRNLLTLDVQTYTQVVLNAYPFAAGHTLVMPRRHLSDLAELTDDEHTELFSTLRKTVAVVRAALKPEGVNVGFNLGKAAGAGIADHLHAHVVPRWNGDTNFMPVLADVRVMPEMLDRTWEKLAPYFAVTAPGAVPAAEPRP